MEETSADVSAKIYPNLNTGKETKRMKNEHLTSMINHHLLQGQGINNQFVVNGQSVGKTAHFDNKPTIFRSTFPSCELKSDKSLENLSTNLQMIREEGFCKLSRLVRDLHTEKHFYKHKLDEVGQILDSRVAKIKAEVDEIHYLMKEKLNEMKTDMSKKISIEIETCRKHVREMNKLVQSGLDAFQSASHDYQYLFQLNLEILEKVNYMKSLNNSLHLTTPVFTTKEYTKDELVKLIGNLNEGGSHHCLKTEDEISHALCHTVKNCKFHHVRPKTTKPKQNFIGLQKQRRPFTNDR